MFVLGKGGGGGVVELARCMLHPGHKKGFNMHKYLEEETATRKCNPFFFRNSCLRAPSPFEICRSSEALSLYF